MAIIGVMSTYVQRLKPWATLEGAGIKLEFHAKLTPIMAIIPYVLLKGCSVAF